MTNINNEIIIDSWQDKANKYNIGKNNKTTVFAMPMIDIFLFKTPNIKKFLVNAYLEDIDLEHNIENPIFLLFKVKERDKSNFKQLESILLKNPNYVYDYYVGHNEEYDDLVMYIFKVPEIHKINFENFKKGNYSKFTTEYKNIFPKEAINSGIRVESKVYGVIHKTANLKKYLIEEFVINKNDVKEFEEMLNTAEEWWDSPKINEEYFHYKN